MTGATYWNDKIAAFLHDPFDKALKIKDHENRAMVYLQAMGVDRCQEEFWRVADILAAGFERGVLPGYHTDQQKSGAVDFLLNPIITHPVSSDRSVQMQIEGGNIHVDEIVNLIKSDNKFIEKGDEKTKARNRFYYLYFLLRYRLASKNVLGLGSLWHRLPADTRIPDHSIWHHNALVSALYSSMELTKPEDGVAVAVLSITPVQGFIAKARKLRDYWTSSVLLSWLAFEGIQYIMENLGPDHVLYPSLIDQPLVEMYLKKVEGFDQLIAESCLPKPSEIATFPNKFLFIVPYTHATNICEKVKETINRSWNNVSDNICKSIATKCATTDQEKRAIEKIFKRQTYRFWDINYAYCRILSESDIAELSHYFEEEVYTYSKEIANRFSRLSLSTSQGCFYNVTHRLVQSALASGKVKRVIHREHENGEKCHLCGEFEVVHAIEHPERLSASEYRKAVRSFWESLQKKYGQFDFSEGERLCSICLMKRVIPLELQKSDHLLSCVFSNGVSFPSTTEIALDGFFIRYGIENKEDKWEIAQKFHESEELKKVLTNTINTPDKRKIKIYEQDKYYAILLMDGDNMGALINGEAVASRWDTVLHPEVVSKFKNKTIEQAYTDVWNDIFNSTTLNKRMLSPAVHATISEALSDFSLFSVKEIVQQFRGKLIYAGGDDVCAIMPASNALNAAYAIQAMYRTPFVFIDSSGKTKPLCDDTLSLLDEGKEGKVAYHLGKGENISISAAILICHHKESLSKMIARAHDLLDNVAKNQCGRNACAIELRKRSGGSRYFAAKWDDPVWDNFKSISELLKDRKLKERLSTSLIYRLEEMYDGILALIQKDATLELYKKFVIHLLTKSLLSKSNPLLEKIAWDIVAITKSSVDVIKKEDSNYKVFKKGDLTGGLLIATFLVGGGQ